MKKERACKLALFIREKEGGDLLVLEIATLLHDISYFPYFALKRALMVAESGKEHRSFLSYFTGTADHAELSARIARNSLEEMSLPHNKIKYVCTVIREHNKPVKSYLESKILNDGDVLDRRRAT